MSAACDDHHRTQTLQMHCCKNPISFAFLAQYLIFLHHCRRLPVWAGSCISLSLFQVRFGKIGYWQLGVRLVQPRALCTKSAHNDASLLCAEFLLFALFMLSLQAWRIMLQLILMDRAQNEASGDHKNGFLSGPSAFVVSNVPQFYGKLI